MNKNYYTIDKLGNFDFRDLQEEDKNFTWFILYHGNDNSLLRTINFWKV